jgi:hypothetical protein
MASGDFPRAGAQHRIANYVPIVAGWPDPGAHCQQAAGQDAERT